MKNIFFFLMMIISSLSIAQNSSISGKVISSDGEPVSGILVELLPTDLSTLTDTEGAYSFANLLDGNYTIQFNNDANQQQNVILGEQEQLTIVDFALTQSFVEDDLNTFTDLAVLEAGDESTSVSSLLTASRDVFMNKAGFQFGSDVFFRIRGYDSRYTDFMVNGVRFQNPETGWQPFNIVGGLNDVLRYRDVETIGANELENGFGEIGGARDYQLRPSEYGKGGRYTYSHLDRFYNHRVMATYASGQQNDLSFVVSGSKRWAEEGYVDGTYYDAYAGYAAVEGKLSDNYSVMVSAMASPRRRGTNSIHRQEAYDIAGSNFYNADWGWQDGEKRNARLRKNYNPVLSFSNYINLGENTSAQVTGTFMTGHNIASRINRQFAANPDPDYYQNLPSFQNEGEENLAPFNYSQQLDWINFYRENQTETGDEVDEYAGVRANYIVEDNYREDHEYQAIAHFNTNVNDNFTLDYGANFRHYRGNFFQRINDLLGADYWLDVDTFYDNTPSNIANAADPRVYEDEKFGYDYDLNERTYDAFIQGRFTYDKVDFFLSGMIGKSDFWREGNVSTGKFPEVSEGKGEVKDFLLYGGKGGATYKLDNRNYFSASGMYYIKPPQLRTLWETPTTRDGFNDLTDVETVYGGEVNYNHNSPKLKLRATGYATRFEGQAESLLAYSGNDFRDGLGDSEISTAFGNYFTNGIDKLHYGGEFGFDYSIVPEFSVSGAAAVGKYTFMSRPIVTGYTDFFTEATFPENSAFLLDFYEGNTPQTALNGGITYRAPARIILNADFNYYDNSYAGTSALRRTLPVASTFVAPEPGMTQEEVLDYWTEQENLPSASRLNLSLYKEFRFSYEKRLGINASMNNVLDDQGYPSLAFEDIRTENGMPFPTRYRYSPGRTYFINIAYKFM